ncbi:hypothetical protein ZYGR_0AD06390 [Zygosaccharomyces rouxii]|uniref:3-ketodihydrosphingosine reductase TSC10 n=2 Tax=Zygosaccharomyces rouxii TaxID=4956 RepID=C5E1G4_ZYGRC|nr:uncharacterized protein ZYRO0G20768g [Zygosaccharomyces rouxii]KAH9202938.1 hypothetical protein LQ764DRAFT_233000 [Zygosaccharomyces rouxii]GAV51456.1 hypothetical protein ZYGR_0AD06390 [Zygosaccharomyces rouxii]CAR29948.1 ZYRO0G20768p [Zygosaccharomyces rouxii]
MKYELEDQVVLITGGSQGLGKQFAQKYLNETVRSKIIVVSRSANKLQDAIRDIGGYPKKLQKPRTLDEQNDRIWYAPCDLSVPDAVNELFETLFECKLIPTQVLACAGGATPKLIADCTGRELEVGVQNNYLTALYVSQKVSQLLPRCHLVLFSSEAAFFPFIGYGQYAPMKVAIKSLAFILRQELPDARVSCIYPGNFLSEGYAVEETTKPSITKEIEGSSAAITCAECCNRIVWWLEKGYDDVTSDFIGWILMSLDMGLNKHNNNSFLWILQLIIGVIGNLFIVPIYMVFLSWDIKKWHKKQQTKRGKK